MCAPLRPRSAREVGIACDNSLLEATAFSHFFSFFDSFFFFGLGVPWSFVRTHAWDVRSKKSRGFLENVSAIGRRIVVVRARCS